MNKTFNSIRVLVLLCPALLMHHSSIAQNGEFKYETPTPPFIDEASYIAPSPVSIEGIINVYHYQQCGQSWSSNQLGTCSGLTICTDGCALTCAAMILRTSGVDVNPGQLNSWLTSNGGYDSGCLIIWSVAANYSGSKIQWYGTSSYSLSIVKNEIDAGNPVIAKVSLTGGIIHFVVINGYVGGGDSVSDYRVADPALSSETNLSDYNIQGLRIYRNVSTASELVVNGGFESGWNGWVNTGDFYADSRFFYPHSGTSYSYLSNLDGSPGNNLSGGFSQVINIPSGVSPPLLIFYVSINTNETGTTPYDALGVNLNGSQIFFISNVGQPPIGNMPYYTQYSYDMSAYVGQSVTLSFVATTDASLPTVFRIDDVSLSCTVGIKESEFSRVRTHLLNQNYPNPFNSSTSISFSLPAQSFVSLKVFDMTGRDVATIVSEELSAGNHSRQWNAHGLPTGVYFYRLQAGSFIETKKLILLK